jgi:hypothetical protein
VIPEAPVAQVLRRAISRDNIGVEYIMFHVRSDDSSRFSIIVDANNDSFGTVEPQTNSFMH